MNGLLGLRPDQDWAAPEFPDDLAGKSGLPPGQAGADPVGAVEVGQGSRHVRLGDRQGVGLDAPPVAVGDPVAVEDGPDVGPGAGAGVIAIRSSPFYGEVSAEQTEGALAIGDTPPALRATSPQMGRRGPLDMVLKIEHIVNIVIEEVAMLDHRTWTFPPQIKPSSQPKICKQREKH